MRKVIDEAKLILIAIPVLIWTLLPIYHLFILSISKQESMLAGKLWPDEPTLQNFQIVFKQQHYYLNNFWLQMGNSFIVALATGAITLFVATLAAFAISRLKVRGGRTVMNLALATYLIPAAFLAIPMYKAIGTYGLLNTRTALVLAMVALATPYAIWVLKQASDKLPMELDEAAIMDGASSLQLFRLVYLPLMKPSIGGDRHLRAAPRLERVSLRLSAALLRAGGAAGGRARPLPVGRRCAMEPADGGRPPLCHSAGGDLLRLPQEHGHGPDSGVGEELKTDALLPPSCSPL